MCWLMKIDLLYYIVYRYSNGYWVKRDMNIIWMYSNRMKKWEEFLFYNFLKFKEILVVLVSLNEGWLVM